MAGYKMAACADNLLCAPLKDQKLAGTGVGFCNLTKGGDVSLALQAHDLTWQSNPFLGDLCHGKMAKYWSEQS